MSKIDGDKLRSKIEKLLPNCSFDEDNEGQVIIYTGLRMISSDGHLAPWKEREDD